MLTNIFGFVVIRSNTLSSVIFWHFHGANEVIYYDATWVTKYTDFHTLLSVRGGTDNINMKSASKTEIVQTNTYDSETLRINWVKVQLLKGNEVNLSIQPISI